MTATVANVVERTVRTTGPCQQFPCDRAYSGGSHPVPASGIVRHTQTWLSEADVVSVGMVCFEDVGHGEAPGEWQVYLHAPGPNVFLTFPQDTGGGSEHHFAEDVVTALMRSVIGVERANAARKAADR